MITHPTPEDAIVIPRVFFTEHDAVSRSFFFPLRLLKQLVLDAHSAFGLQAVFIGVGAKLCREKKKKKSKHDEKQSECVF